MKNLIIGEMLFIVKIDFNKKLFVYNKMHRKLLFIFQNLPECFSICSSWTSRFSVNVGTHSCIRDYIVPKLLVYTLTEQCFPGFPEHSRGVWSHPKSPLWSLFLQCLLTYQNLLAFFIWWALLLSLATRHAQCCPDNLFAFIPYVCFFHILWLIPRRFSPAWPTCWTPTYSPSPNYNVKVWGRLSLSQPLAKWLAASVYIQHILEHIFTDTFTHTSVV